MDSGKKVKSHNSNFLKRKTNALDKNEFENNINKKVKSDNLIIRKEILHSQTFKGFYISEDNEIKEKTKGSIKDFKNQLGSNNCNIFSIANVTSVDDNAIQSLKSIEIDEHGRHHDYDPM